MFDLLLVCRSLADKTRASLHDERSSVLRASAGSGPVRIWSEASHGMGERGATRARHWRYRQPIAREDPATVSADQIEEHVRIKGADRARVSTIDRIAGMNKIKLTKDA
jgi:hypothetical protein